MLSTLKVFDPQKFDEQTLGIKEVKVEIKEVFIRQTAQILESVAEAVRQSDTDKLGKFLHKLKSSVGLFCQKKMAEELVYLEKNAEKLGDAEYMRRLQQTEVDLQLMIQEVRSFSVE